MESHFVSLFIISFNVHCQLLEVIILSIKSTPFKILKCTHTIQIDWSPKKSEMGVTVYEKMSDPLSLYMQLIRR